MRHLTVLIVFVSALAAGFWFYLPSQGNATREFCVGLPGASSPPKIEELAQDSGYSVARLSSSTFVLSSYRSFHRFKCQVEFREDLLMSANYLGTKPGFITHTVSK